MVAMGPAFQVVSDTAWDVVGDQPLIYDTELSKP